LRHVFADRIYRGNQLVSALAHCGPWRIGIVERPLGVKGFQLLPRRGSSNAPSPGSADAAASPRTSKDPLQPKPHGSSSSISDF
jgi:hypothetical protein